MIIRNFFIFRLVLVGVILGIQPSIAAVSSSDIPSKLLPWQSWVLHGKEEMLCPNKYNDGTVTKCRWPTRMHLDISSNKGRFEQDWLIFAESWVPLPGGEVLWPDNVIIDGKPAAVVLHDNGPSVRLSPGEHHITGEFIWKQIPKMIPVPPSSGLLSLTVNGRMSPTPVIDGNGQLWLQEDHAETFTKEELDVQVYRLITDAIPMQVTSFFRLDVSGKSREIEIKDGLIKGSIPMVLESSLPARITPNGRLNLQARAGRWEVRISARLDGPRYEIKAGKCFYGDEIWSFEPRHDLRMVDIQNVSLIEPGQTEMPVKWRRFQAYLIKADSTMVIKELRRGDPDPAPDQLSLARSIWLDFDGRGVTMHDKISGTLSRQWYLSMNPPAMLGRINVSGQDRVITRQGPEKKMGVELRKGNLNLSADSRLPHFSGILSASNWDHDFQAVKTLLHLPPGWRLFYAKGVDGISDSWLTHWSLLDFFLVLIISLAVFKLRSLLWGVVTLVTMVLIFHETGAPRLVWLHILAVSALLPLLSKGWIKRIVTLWGVGAVIILLITAVPFAVQQIRWGIYPQLEPRYSTYNYTDTSDFRGQEPLQESAKGFQTPAAPESAMGKKAGKLEKRLSSSTAEMDRYGQVLIEKEALLSQTDPDSVIPTGPGLPDWSWKSINLNWNGPVAKEQTIHLYLLSPLINLILSFVRVVLLVVVIWILIDFRSILTRLKLKPITATVGWIAAMVLCAFQFGGSTVHAADFPPDKLLDELRQRLLQKPDCLPNCADIARMELSVKEDSLQVILKVNSAERMAIPLPVNRKSWTPDQILLNYFPIKGLVREQNGQLWGFVPKGVHTIVLLGGSEKKEVLQIPLPLRPHFTTYFAEGWRVEGVHTDGRVGSSIQLTRNTLNESRPIKTRPGNLAPFLKVERILNLGLTWQTSTTIRRLTPTGTPIVIRVPLLAEESVTTSNITVENGHALINLASDQRSITYNANLKTKRLIELYAPAAVPWTETWVLAAGPVWHCDFEGIPVVHHQNRDGRWQPRWQPWPGEKVSLYVQRPTTVKAQTKTIDQIRLMITPGIRSAQSELKLTVRTGSGGQHTLELPPKAALQQVNVNDRTIPVKKKGARVTIPLQPGGQKIMVKWQQEVPFSYFFKVPPLDIGHKAVNAEISLRLPNQCWVLLAGGPSLGPAVLFWSYLVVIVLAAFALGRVSVTPMKTRQWLLLGLGLTQVPAVLAVIIVGWLIILGLRERQIMPQNGLAYNTIQIGIVIMTLIALWSLFTAVKAGLVGMPEMQISGNQSTYRVLNWTQDRVIETLPRPWVLSLSVWIYRILMLAWSLWLALTLLGWLKWGWGCITKGGGWRKLILPWPKRKPVMEVKE
jgi:hypothetical protein